MEQTARQRVEVTSKVKDFWDPSSHVDHRILHLTTVKVVIASSESVEREELYEVEDIVEEV